MPYAWRGDRGVKGWNLQKVQNFPKGSRGTQKERWLESEGGFELVM